MSHLNFPFKHSTHINEILKFDIKLKEFLQNVREISTKFWIEWNQFELFWTIMYIVHDLLRIIKYSF